MDSVIFTTLEFPELVVSLIWLSCTFTNTAEVTNTQVKMAEHHLSVCLLLVNMIKGSLKASRLWQKSARIVLLPTLHGLHVNGKLQTECQPVRC